MESSKHAQRLKGKMIIKNTLKKTVKQAGKRKGNYIGDRIMADRRFTDFDAVHKRLLDPLRQKYVNIEGDLSVSNIIDKTMLPTKGRVLKLIANMKSPTQEKKMDILLDLNRNEKPSYRNRHIPVHPDKILEAPNVDKFFKNIIDWGNNDYLAVALGSDTHLWNSVDCKPRLFCKLPESASISCLKWINKDEKAHNVLAIAFSEQDYNYVSLLDMSGSIVAYVGNAGTKTIFSMGYRNGVLSLGYDDGSISHYDIMSLSKPYAICNYHKQKITQIKWSCDGRYLAASSSDGSVSVWHRRSLNEDPAAEFKENHLTGVNDIEWNPKSYYQLAVTGGQQNNLLKIFHVVTKQCLRSVDIVDSILCIYWSNYYGEIATGVETSDETSPIRLWDDEHLTLVKEIVGHRATISSLTASPNNEAFATIGIDEQLRIWHCFVNGKKCRRPNTAKSTSLLDEMERFKVL